MVGYQASGAAPFVRVRRWRRRRRSRAQSGSATPSPSTSPSPPRLSPADGSTPSRTSRSLKRRRRLRNVKAYSASPRRRYVSRMMRDLESGRIPEGSTIVCTLTGHGLKDPDIAVNGQCSVVSVAPKRPR